MLEKDIEKKFVAGVKALGGNAFKFASHGNAGMPDRIVVYPNGGVEFVELKTKRGRLTPLQGRQLSRLIELGAAVYVLYGEEDVKTYLSGLRGRIA